MGSGPKRAKLRRGFAEAEAEAPVVAHDDALSASIKRARAEVKKGIYSKRSVKDIARAGAKKLRVRPARRER